MNKLSNSNFSRVVICLGAAIGALAVGSVSCDRAAAQGESAKAANRRIILIETNPKVGLPDLTTYHLVRDTLTQKEFLITGGGIIQVK